MKYDFLIVGSGLFGSVFARQMTDKGKKCLVIDKRSHIGGNCYTENIHNIEVHKYGPHIFHTNSREIWDYINQFSDFRQFIYRPKVNFKGQIYSFPINLFTLYQVYGVTTPEDAKNILETIYKEKIDNPQNLEEYAINEVGLELYHKFIYGYTKKQWNREPRDLPKSIIARLPVRLNYDDNYFNDEYQGIPKNGYTEIFNNLLTSVDTEIGVDYLKDRDKLDSMAKRIVYTGPIDEFFNYQYDALEWRSLRFEEEILDIEDYQGTYVINYTDYNIPYTRICEHKHFLNNKSNKTIITKEYPQNWTKDNDRYYPVNDKENIYRYLKYRNLIDENKYIFGGRLAEYKYYDMHQVIARALKIAGEIND